MNLNKVLCEKQAEYQKIQHKIILLYDNAPLHTAKLIKKMMDAFS